jgi:acyltransferase
VERNTTLDTVKAYGVLLVLVGHLNMPFWVINFIYFFHIPLFIIVSGILHKQKKPSEGFKTNLRIFLSYIVYGLIFICFEWIRKGEFNFDMLTDLCLSRPIGIWGIPFFGPFWFIIVLMIVKIMATFIPLNKWSLILSFGLFFLIFYLNKRYPGFKDLPFALAQSLALFCFYVIGYLSRNYIKRIPSGINILAIFLFFIIGSISIIHYGGSNGKIINFHQLEMFNPFVAFLLSILGSMSMFWIVEITTNAKKGVTKIIQTIGEYTFTYFAWHLFLYFIIGYIAVKIGLSEIKGLSIFIFATTVVVIYFSIDVFIKRTKTNPFIRRLIFFK